MQAWRTIGLLAVAIVALAACSAPTAADDPAGTTTTAGAAETTPEAPADTAAAAVATVEAMIAAFNAGDVGAFDQLVGATETDDPSVAYTMFGPMFLAEAKMASNGSFEVTEPCTHTGETPGGRHLVRCDGIERSDFMTPAGLELQWFLEFHVADGKVVDSSEEPIRWYDQFDGSLIPEGEEWEGADEWPYGPLTKLSSSFLTWFYETHPDVAAGIEVDRSPLRAGLKRPPPVEDYPLGLWGSKGLIKDAFPTVLEYVDEFLAAEPNWAEEWEADEKAGAFLDAWATQDLETIGRLVAEDVTFSWGPAADMASLPAGFAWEEAAGFSHVPLDCVSVETIGDIQRATCLVRANSEIAEAAGTGGGVVCAQVTVADGLITKVGVDSGPDCPYDYWSNVFQPFDEWLRDTHPETTLDAMYDDRLSPEGIALWEQYVNEFIAARG